MIVHVPINYCIACSIHSNVTDLIIEDGSSHYGIPRMDYFSRWSRETKNVRALTFKHGCLKSKYIRK